MLEDTWPTPTALAVLSHFFSTVGFTQLQLDVSAYPSRRLLDGSADLIFHRTQPGNEALEHLRICEMEMIPVAAPGFFGMPLTDDLTREHLQTYVQCVGRGATHSSSDEHVVASGARQLIIGDHHVRHRAILEGMAWGYVPSWLAEADLHSGRLLSIAGKYLKKSVEELSAARLRTRTHGPLATRLWTHLQQLTPAELQPPHARANSQPTRHCVTAR
jgi:DNA-binding transcriptional LysR family regulator